jgi:hypothetical protein
MYISRVVLDSFDSLTWWVVGGVFLSVSMLIVYGVCLMVSCVMDILERGE